MNKGLWFQLKTKLTEYLCPPGEGVFTLKTGQDKRKKLQSLLYGDTDIRQSWEKSLEQLPDVVLPLVLGVCSDAGGGILRGANWGPLYIREKLYQQPTPPAIFDLGDVRVIPHLLMDKYLNAETLRKCSKALYQKMDSSMAVSPLSITEEVVNGIYQLFPEKHILGLGGDHSVSYPLAKGYLVAKKRAGKKVGLIHFDAHTDMLDERLGIDICFGTWASHAMHFLPAPSHLIQIGIRSSRHGREHWEKNYGIKQFWAGEILSSGIEKTADDLIAYIRTLELEEVYITFDIDALDLKYAAATGTPEANGLTLDQAMYLLRAITNEIPVTGADIMEVAPFISTQYTGTPSAEPETTLQSACTIATFLLQQLTAVPAKHGR